MAEPSLGAEQQLKKQAMAQRMTRYGETQKPAEETDGQKRVSAWREQTVGEEQLWPSALRRTNGQAARSTWVKVALKERQEAARTEELQHDENRTAEVQTQQAWTQLEEKQLGQQKHRTTAQENNSATVKSPVEQSHEWKCWTPEQAAEWKEHGIRQGLGSGEGKNRLQAGLGRIQPNAQQQKEAR
jgi:hypothetical protein